MATDTCDPVLIRKAAPASLVILVAASPNDVAVRIGFDVRVSSPRDKADRHERTGQADKATPGPANQVCACARQRTERVTLRLTVRVDGLVDVRLSAPMLGCSVSLRRHSIDPLLGDTRLISVGSSWQPCRLDVALSMLLGITTARAAELLSLGAVHVNGSRLMTPEVLLAPTAFARVHLEPRRFRMPAYLHVVGSCADFVIVDKPNGVPVHGKVDNAIENVLAAASEQLGERLFLTSRLDRPTSGLLVLARSARAQSEFNAQLRERRVYKEYRALVLPARDDARGGARDGACDGTFLLKAPSTLVHWMGPGRTEPKVLSRTEIPGWQRCESELLAARRVFAAFNSDNEAPACKSAGLEVYEVSILLGTGRTHQLRAQLSFEGHPILGDEMYGAPGVASCETADADAASTDHADSMGQAGDVGSNQCEAAGGYSSGSACIPVFAAAGGHTPTSTQTNPRCGLPTVRAPRMPIALHATRLRFVTSAPDSSLRFVTSAPAGVRAEASSVQGMVQGLATGELEFTLEPPWTRSMTCNF